MYLRSIIAIAGMLVTSCLSPHQTVVTDTGGGTWSESAEIEIPNADTVTPRDLYIVVRYNDSFRDDTLRLTIRTISPDSLVFEESYTLGLPPRRHLAALAEEASVPYRRHVIFPDSGIYRMAFTPAMPVRGVEAIGINQQKANKTDGQRQTQTLCGEPHVRMFRTTRLRGGLPPRPSAQRTLAQRLFHNDRPIVLELGCGKGEYTVALAERDPNRNFIGIDIKGARMWRGAKTATERQMRNVGFLRTRIEMIASFFAEGEVDEIWITFPDPQLKSRRAKKRLTSPLFLGQYAQMQVPGGRINLKTDSQHLYAYTQAVIERFGLPCDVANNDIYGSGFADEILSVKTAYEQMFLERKLPITYTRFSLGERRDFPPFDWEGDDTDEKDNEEARKNDISDRTSRSSYANP